jgi:hypothetical protein
VKIADFFPASGCSLRTVLLVLATSVGAISLASGQSTSDFAISSPEPVVQLIKVEHLPGTSGSLHFTFSNISNKTILEICISAPNGLEMVCQSGFANGAKPTGPGDTLSFSMDPDGFAPDGQQNSLHVNAIVYTDGSHMGEQRILAKEEDRMFGLALETKRISDLLSNCADGSVAGLDSVLPRIGANQPTKVEAAEAVRGESLPGISRSVIDIHLSRLHMQGLFEGVAELREVALRDINEKKAMAASPLTGGKKMQQAVLDARSHGLSDLAQKYRLLSQTQIGYLSSFLGERNTQ